MHKKYVCICKSISAHGQRGGGVNEELEVRCINCVFIVGLDSWKWKMQLIKLGRERLNARVRSMYAVDRDVNYILRHGRTVIQPRAPTL